MVCVHTNECFFVGQVGNLNQHLNKRKISMFVLRMLQVKQFVVYFSQVETNKSATFVRKPSGLDNHFKLQHILKAEQQMLNTFDNF